MEEHVSHGVCRSLPHGIPQHYNGAARGVYHGVAHDTTHGVCLGIERPARYLRGYVIGQPIVYPSATHLVANGVVHIVNPMGKHFAMRYAVVSNRG